MYHGLQHEIKVSYLYLISNSLKKLKKNIQFNKFCDMF